MTTSPHSLLCQMDQIRIVPHITAGIRLNNCATGATYGKRTFSMSTSLPLLKTMGILAGTLLLMRLFCLAKKSRREQNLRKKYRKKIRAMKEKMSKS